MSYPFGTSATIIDQSIDNFGDRTTGDSLVVEGCVFWETSSTEETENQNTVITQATLLLPPGTPVDSTKRIQLDDGTYEVVGEPIAWRSSLTGHKPGIEVHLRKVAG